MSRIGIIGAGAVGLLLASYLAEHHQITLYTRQLDDGTKRILRDNQWSPTVKVRPIAHFESQDLVFVTTKSYDIKSVIPYLEHEKNPVVFLQNGMGHLDAARALPQAIFGVVEHGAMKTGPYEIRHTGKGRIRYGNHVLSMLKRDALQFEHVTNIEAVMVTKLFMNAVINPLTAYYGVENGRLLDEPYASKARAVFAEVRSVFPNHPITYDEIEQILKRTRLNRSSMLRDVEQGRMTEIDPIVGYVLKQATQPTPLLAYYFQEIKHREQEGDSL
ncbi:MULTISPECIES: 2-dehydropantoate 2-reductase [unclassified Exiguobacterium]|uniref:ketopantoate reductase family protein n=1 Tax=unclassified Exiguobacterium TaxID=2644629 RepID=UPI000B58F080|nr:MULTISPECIES: 2-dehydropantoate 2-reductase [unclassified Exiguobacterium]ASI35833.1 2-dehydropantoate 2-reductase [Exiguobacterium sp. N4-1P]